MSTSLLVVVPLALLAIVLVLCFVGCEFDSTGTGGGGELGPWTQYTDVTILEDPRVVAYWPLGDAAGPTAVDLKGGHDGTYVDATTTPAQFPYPAASFDTPAGTFNSAAAPGTLQFGQTGIVAGDTVGGDSNVRTTCIQVNGGYVNVPFNEAFNPANKFTIEAWVRVEWTAGDPAALRIVIDARGVNPNTGFALYATQDNRWEASVGDGSDGVENLILAVGEPIAFEATSYLAVTFDGTDLILFVDGQQSSQTVQATYVANTTVPLFIGTGAPSIPLRPAPNGGPFFPFLGQIQCVAVYNDALPPDVIEKHMHNGNGV
jgi:hypothetical protein